jgi:murein DD-endopeptidase MepM/ murein hydrolase activator NlpD
MRRALFLPVAALLLIAAERPLPPDQETEHVVRSGETLMGIANRAKVPRVLIAEANGLKEPYVVRTGQKLKIPRTRQHVVKRGDTGFIVAYTYAVPWHDIAVANNLDPDAALRPGQKLLIPTIIDQPDTIQPSPQPASRFAWPLSGTVRRGFAPRTGGDDYHDGIDVTAREGTAVRAAAAGKVMFAGNEPKQFGNLVVIDHGNGWASAYAFLSRVTVAKDEEVRAGERVGLVGHTGLAHGSELHFELRRNNRPVDPETQLAPPFPAPAATPAPRTRSPSPDRPPASSRSRSGGSAAPARDAPARARSRE